jgi:hypothetical protein
MSQSENLAIIKEQRKHGVKMDQDLSFLVKERLWGELGT